MRILFLSAIAAFMLTTCAAPKPLPRPPVSPPIGNVILPPAPVPPKPAISQPAGHWTDWPMETGSWSYAKDVRGSIARYGVPGKDAVVMLRCDKARARIFLSRSGGAAGSMTVRTSSASKALAVQPIFTQPPYAVSELMVSDPILDAVAFSRGRIALELPGAQNIAIPVWSEIGRVIEDCRN